MCPPGVDQTMRTAQRWLFVAPELRQKQEVPLPSLGGWRSYELTDHFLDTKTLPWDAWSMLARPVIPTRHIASSHNQVHNLIKPPSRLYVLSTEILDMVVEYLIPGEKDLLAFGLTSDLHWQIVLRHIHAKYYQACAPWAGTKLALQGSYSTDLPLSFEENGLAESITGESWFGNMCAARKFFWAHHNFEAPNCVKNLETSIVQAMNGWKVGSGIPEIRWEVMEMELSRGDLFPRNQVWVLRNLTTRELISTDKSISTKMKTRGSAKPALNLNDTGLDNMLLMRICWTSIPSYGSDKKLDIHRGVWAGHRFDIVSLDVHRAEEKEADWKDVTEEVKKEAEILQRRIDSLKR